MSSSALMPQSGLRSIRVHNSRRRSSRLSELVAGDDGGVDGADRGADDPVRLDAGFMHGLIDAALVGAERAAALEHQDHLPGQGRPRRGEAGGLMDDIVHGRMTALCSFDERLAR